MESVKWNRLFFDSSIEIRIDFFCTDMAFFLLHSQTFVKYFWKNKNIAFFVVIPSSFWLIELFLCGCGCWHLFSNLGNQLFCSPYERTNERANEVPDDNN